jgi:hypothetical protein
VCNHPPALCELYMRTLSNPSPNPHPTPTPPLAPTLTPTLALALTLRHDRYMPFNKSILVIASVNPDFEPNP